MRILANYGYRANGDSYSVTFETMGDVPKDQADSVVDELFRMAKGAIERQVNPVVRVDDTPKESVTIPQPVKQVNGNGNGNGKEKPAIKDPDAPITKKQKDFIIKLAKQRGQFVDNLSSMSMQTASSIIEELLAV